MRAVRCTSQFKKDIARLKRHGADLSPLKRVIDGLAAGTLHDGAGADRVRRGRAAGMRLRPIPSQGNLLYEQREDDLILVRLFVPHFSGLRAYARRMLPPPRPAWQAHTLVLVMLKNYLKIALRNLRKQPLYSFINISGLAVGIACCVLMLLYVQDEYAFDAIHHKGDRIYRVVEARQSPDQGTRHIAYTMGPLAPALESDFPEVVQTLRMIGRSVGRATVGYGQNRFYEGDHLFAEPSFFELFDFEMRRGDPQTALNAPLSVVLTETAARKYFGDLDPFGKTLSAGRFGDFEVTGILRDPPVNSHLQFSMLFSFATLEGQDGWKEWIADWQSDGFITYVLLEEGQSAANLEAGLAALGARHRDAESTAARQVHLQALGDVHFQSSHIEFDRNDAKTDLTYLYVFSAIALFIILIACINYMNLATAQSMKRAREVGMRKVVGAHRWQLIGQFLGESLLFTVVALVVALVLVMLFLPAFNAFTGKALHWDLSTNGAVLLGLLGLTLIVGLLSGSYPAFYLSRFSPAVVLKGKLAVGSGAALLRQGLVVAQFALSIGMIVSTVVVYNQLDYIRSKRLGFDQEHLVVVDVNSGNSRQNFQVFKDEVMRLASVQSVAVSSRVPGEWKDIPLVEVQPEGATDDAVQTMSFLGVDEDFLETFQMETIAGRFFTGHHPTDSTTVLINEAAARLLGWDDPIGRRIRVPRVNRGGRSREVEFTAEIVGVVRDFHFRSLHEQIGPMVLGWRLNPIQAIDYYTLRISGDDVPATIAQLEAIHKAFDDTPFELNFLDAQLNRFYQDDQRVGGLFGVAAALAIFIACLGLFGLAAFMAQQRTKEIGVRKVLGASVGGIVLLLSKDFARLLLIAFVLALPTYFLMERWLSTFAYRIEISWWMFFLSGLAALVIASLTVSYQAIKAAVADPVRALRYE